MAEKAPTNAPEWSVSDLAGALKRTLEDAFGHVRLRGEISGFRGPHSSGHVYFCLKDESARIDAVIWKGTYGRLRFKPQEGIEVIATGRITTFPGKSAYQIVVESLVPAGIGALMQILEERRRKLAAEGLFAESRKRPLPFLPRVVGVVTSPTGAVIRDILHRLEDRFPRHVLVWPVRVQGETSAEEVAAAIQGFNALAPDGAIPRPDVIIVARGGGSIEDLWGFNEEIVVRAAAESGIPLVSAVGHETDWTLIDHAADYRAPTPTGAAEKVVPVRIELMGDVRDLGRRHLEAMLRSLEYRRRDLRAQTDRLPQPEGLFALKQQRLDLLSAKLAPALMRHAGRFSDRLHKAVERLAVHSPSARLAAMRARLIGIGGTRSTEAAHRLLRSRAERLENLGRSLTVARNNLVRSHRVHLERQAERVSRISERLEPAVLRHIALRRAGLDTMAQLFDSLNYRAVLSRGYTLIWDANGRPVRSAKGAADGEVLAVEFADGKLDATVGRLTRSRPAARQRLVEEQGALF
jgi:exodeoxyribonuclease VII large subunit